MTGPGGLTWDELDELADFAEGLLDGPAHERVAALVRADERWALAYASLVETVPAVRSVLQAAGQVPAPVPDDVVIRLETALAEQAAASRPGRRLLAGPGRGRPTAPTGPPTGPPTKPTTRRRASQRVRRRFAAGATAALALVAVVTFGALALHGGVAVNSTTDAGPAAGRAAPGSGYAQRPEADPTQAAAGGTGGTDAARVPLLASGTDYRPDTLHLLVDAPPASTVTLSGNKADAAAADALSPLGTSEGLSACFAAVLVDHHGRVTLADYARFDGQPALVIVVVSGQTSTVVAVGAGCGRTGADELAAVDVP